MLNKAQVYIVNNVDIPDYEVDSGIIGAEQIYIYNFKNPEHMSEQELQGICDTFGEFMISAYFLVGMGGPYEELSGAKENGFKKVILSDKSMDIKKRMFRLFLEGDATPDENKIFLFKEKKELNVKKDMEIEDRMIVIAPVLDTTAIGIFSKGIDLAKFFK
ncbi:MULTISPECIES: hypothetical protein [Listeria]|uniref:Uncharacterized protein n=1 Tax=Listeria immobilis TaxID=2713502 RepID=A0A7X0X7D3_9LIST|nr:MULTISPECIES: hypothetical protein [Listeria]AIS61592.1 hypothetical protein JL53_02110 [Listeria ivanovii subsp. londoniensis]MBC1488905.1 hypothetical protein [Listeria immobilis]MBC1515943.1 hypothetical protein [Listeria immobilis]MBK1965980.1 hypothetical protein [Listeria ivanovii subsp. londoniensis]MBK1984325.1 hypothetical protein [Listeria ivanovii subsp. londoniensis]